MRCQGRFALCALLALTSVVTASPRVARLTPPSERFASGANDLIVSRFLPGQRFDVQATLVPDAGNEIKTVEFTIDEAPITNTATSRITTGLKPALGDGSATPAGTTVASIRAVSVEAPGRHLLRVRATQSDGQTVSATGDFWVEPLVGRGQRVRNVILLLGDGMGVAQRTAGRIVARGYAQGKAKGLLAMDTFPDVALVRTASLNSVVTDSAPGMSNYVTGNKSANDTEGVWPDDTVDPFDNPRIEYLSEYLHRTEGKALGIVTTADLYDATPAANAVHTGSRRAGTGIVDQYLDDRALTGLRVLMGGGRGWFLPLGSAGSLRSAKTDYQLPRDVQQGWGAAAGAIDPARNLIGDFADAGFQVASTSKDLATVVPDKPLLGLFAYGNMNVAYDKIRGRRGTGEVTAEFGLPDQPMLDEMAQTALSVLERSPKGFYLMIEGASIDKQAHAMDSDRWIDEVIEFDRAVAVARAFAQRHPDTLVLVTADHETGGSSIIGASRVTTAELQALSTGAAGQQLRNGVVGTYDNAGFPRYRLLADGYPESMDPDHKLLIGYGANTDRHENWLSNPRPLVDHYQPNTTPSPFPVYPTGYPANARARDTDGALLITGQVGEENEAAVHTGADVPLSAFGAGSRRFHGVIDNTDVFFAIARAVRKGAVEIDR